MNTLRRFNSRKVVGGISNYCNRMLSSESEPVTERPKTEKCVNKVTLLGRVGREGEVRGTSEHPCLIFPLATSLTYRKASTGEYLTKTDWHRIVVFQQGLRNIASTIGKGDRILIEGSLSHQRFTDSDNGKPVNITSIIADDITFLSKPRNRQDFSDEEMEESH